MIDRSGGQKHDRHERRANDRRFAANQIGVGEQRGYRDPGGTPRRHASNLAGEQEQAGENGDVAAGDGNHVVRASLLQPPLRLSIQTGAVTDQDRGDDAG